MPGVGIGEVTSRKLDLTILSASVNTQETATSLSYTDLATVGPSVAPTTNVAVLGQDMISLVSVSLDNTNSAASSFAAVAIDGVGVDEDFCLLHVGTNQEANGSTHRYHTGKLPGTAYRPMYRVSSNTGLFSERYVTVMAM